MTSKGIRRVAGHHRRSTATPSAGETEKIEQAESASAEYHRQREVSGGDDDTLKPSGWWTRRKAIAVALVGFAAVFFGAINDGAQVIGRGWDTVANRQPGRDVQRLSALRVDVLREEFDREAGVPPVAQLGDSVGSGPNSQVQLKQFLYVLDTAFVQAFVNSSNSVVAFAVTVRSESPLGEVKAGIYVLDIGRIRIAEVPFSVREWVGYVDGAHHAAYFEVSKSIGADRFQQVAVGWSSTGGSVGDPHGGIWPDARVIQAQPRAKYAGDQGYSVMDIYEPREEYYVENRKQRLGLVNAYAVVSSQYVLTPEMIGLHPHCVTVRRFSAPVTVASRSTAASKGRSRAPTMRARRSPHQRQFRIGRRDSPSGRCGQHRTAAAATSQHTIQAAPVRDRLPGLSAHPRPAGTPEHAAHLRQFAAAADTRAQPGPVAPASRSAARYGVRPPTPARRQKAGTSCLLSSRA